MPVATRVAGLRTQRRVVPVIASRVAFRITTKLHIRKTREGTGRIGAAWKAVVNLGRYAHPLYFTFISVDARIRASMDCSTIFRCELDCRYEEHCLTAICPSSKAHFQHAITSSYVSSYISGLAIPESVEASVPSEGEDKTKKLYKCPHENCPNRYKQLSGLRYHLAHVRIRVSDGYITQLYFQGHPVDLPKQLELVPPALSRKLAEKMRLQGQGSSPLSSEHQTRNNSLEASNHTAFNS